MVYDSPYHYEKYDVMYFISYSFDALTNLISGSKVWHGIGSPIRQDYPLNLSI